MCYFHWVFVHHSLTGRKSLLHRINSALDLRKEVHLGSLWHWLFLQFAKEGWELGEMTGNPFGFDLLYVVKLRFELLWLGAQGKIPVKRQKPGQVSLTLVSQVCDQKRF